MSDASAPTRQRVSRAAADAAARTRRRKFNEDDEGVDFNLWVDKSKLDPNYQYRWVNDARGRIKKLESQDWDLVPEEEAGCPVDRHGDIAAGKSEDLRVRLMRKPQDWYQEDHRRKQGRIDELMQSAAAGTPLQEKGSSGESLGGLSAAHAYRPKSANEGL